MSAPEFSNSLEFQMRPDLRAVRQAAAQVRTFLAAQDLSEKELTACELAFVEACNNAVQHGPAEKPVRIDLQFQTSDIRIRVHDENPAFKVPPRGEPPPPDRESGRGLFLMQAMMDEVSNERTDAGNCLLLRKTITSI